MDIRNFFKRDNNNQPPKPSTRAAPAGSSTSRKGKQSEKKRKKITFESDSDDDEFQGKSTKVQTKSSPVKQSSKPASSISKTSERKSISTSDFFGDDPVKQSKKPNCTTTSEFFGNAPVKQSKKRSRDEELFEETLQDLDSRDEKNSAGELSQSGSEGETLSSKLSKKRGSADKPGTSSDIIDITESPNKQDSQAKKRKIEKTEEVSSSKVSSGKRSQRTTPTSPEKSKVLLVTKKNESPVKKNGSKTPVRSSPRKRPSEKKDNLEKKEITTDAIHKTKRDSNDGSQTAKKSEEKSHEEEIPEDVIVPTPSKGASFRSYLMRDGPRALGSREVPDGAPDCLHGLSFVITGVLESIERDEMKILIEGLGGKVTQTVSKKTSYLVHGRDAGVSKTSKAQQLGVKLLDEDGLFELIKSKPAGPKAKVKPSVVKGKGSANSVSSKLAKFAAKSEVVEEANDVLPMSSDMASHKISNSKQAVSSKDFSRKQEVQAACTKSSLTSPHKSNLSSPKSSTSAIEKSNVVSPEKPSTSTTASSAPSLMLVDKYKPLTMKQIIGQQGDKSNMRRLVSWLTNWHKQHGKSVKAAAKRWGDDTSFRAALLSGPPGIGKTTTAQVVCKELGWSFVELNASDTRSKTSLKEWVATALACRSLDDMKGQKHCLLMDEVDGMAGNEDRGGMQELINLIKTSKIPIICMCNDRQSQKVRSLSNHCVDLRFQRPRVEQIKAMLMSVSCKEGIKVDAQVMNQIIAASNQDIRQCLHHLSMWAEGGHKNLAEKDLKLGPFEVIRLVFAPETGKKNLNQQADLFFHDYSLAPLFVQENYIQVKPIEANSQPQKTLQCLSECADSLANSDLVDKRIRSTNSWNLLPVQAMYASVIPGRAMRGFMGGMIQFPSWLGKNSTTNKNNRLSQELASHMALNAGCSPRSLVLDYLPAMRRALSTPLEKDGSEGVPRVLETLTSYDLLKDDMDSIMELSSWPGRHQVNIPSTVKAALTRGYNKMAPTLPYSLQVNVSKKSRGPALSQGGEDDEEQVEAVESDDEGDSLKKDAMIKQSKPSKNTKKEEAAKKKEELSGKKTAKGKGKGKKK